MPYEPAALRRGLEDRLKARAADSRLPLDRLRKEAALQRLLARIAVAAPPDSWALKGGLLMIARVGPQARATADADATWRTAAGLLRDILEQAVELDLADHFGFLVGEPRRLQGEGGEGGLRFPVMARVANREFERIRLDVNIVPGDPRPVEEVPLRNLFDFAHLDQVIVPAITPAQQLAEKLHAYTRMYGSGDNSRAKDLYDMLVIAEQLPLPRLETFVAACHETFHLRETDWPPPRLNEPPSRWEAAWRGYVNDYGISFGTLREAYSAFTGFWAAPIAGRPRKAQWAAESWAWEIPTGAGGTRTS
jgi:hypothetical protein